MLQLKRENMSLFGMFRKLKTLLYSGGEKSSREEAVIINCTSTIQGVKAEYQYLEKHYGRCYPPPENLETKYF